MPVVAISRSGCTLGSTSGLFEDCDYFYLEPTADSWHELVGCQENEQGFLRCWDIQIGTLPWHRKAIVALYSEPTACIVVAEFVGNAWNDGDIETLTALRQLRRVDLAGTRMTEAGVSRLRKALPHTEVVIRREPRYSWDTENAKSHRRNTLLNSRRPTAGP